jgi:hypothetical protein
LPDILLLFPEKEAKSVVPLRGRLDYPNLEEADTTGCIKLTRKTIGPVVAELSNSSLLFPEKEAKSVVPLRGRLDYPNLDEADTTGSIKLMPKTIGPVTA